MPESVAEGPQARNPASSLWRPTSRRASIALGDRAASDPSCRGPFGSPLSRGPVPEAAPEPGRRLRGIPRAPRETRPPRGGPEERNPPWKRKPAPPRARSAASRSAWREATTARSASGASAPASASRSTCATSCAYRCRRRPTRETSTAYSWTAGPCGRCRESSRSGATTTTRPCTRGSLELLSSRGSLACPAAGGSRGGRRRHFLPLLDSM